MYLHIGKNVLLRKEELIGVFSVDSLKKDSKGKKYLNALEQEGNFQDISDGKWSSVVLTDDRVFITRISSATLLQRSGDSLREMLGAAEMAASGGGAEQTPSGEGE